MVYSIKLIDILEINSTEILFLKKNIVHLGKVLSRENDLAAIEIERTTACSSCRANAVCGISETGKRILKIQTDDSIQCGDLVEVSIDAQTGKSVILYGFFIPFLALLGGLLIGFLLFSSELAAALSALTLLCIYYLMLFIIRSKIENKIHFGIEKKF
jgi:sigma-E factor negative regulatory protein RseC